MSAADTPMREPRGQRATPLPSRTGELKHEHASSPWWHVAPALPAADPIACIACCRVRDHARGETRLRLARPGRDCRAQAGERAARTGAAAGSSVEAPPVDAGYPGAVSRALAGAVQHARAAGDRHRAGDQGGAGLRGGAHGGAGPGAALLDECAWLPRRGRGWRDAPQPRRDGGGRTRRGTAAVRHRDHGAAGGTTGTDGCHASTASFAASQAPRNRAARSTRGSAGRLRIAGGAGTLPPRICE